MKKLIHIALGLALVFGMSSCEDYLDVNTDPDNPVSKPYHRSFVCRGYRTITLMRGVRPACVPIRLPVL